MLLHRRLGVLGVSVVLVSLLVEPFGSAVDAVGPSAAELSGSVKSTMGAPIAGAIVNVNGHQFTTNADGSWHGRLPFEPVYHYWASAEGFGLGPQATSTTTTSGPTLDVLPISLGILVLPSLFEVDATMYAGLLDTVAPTITQFATDQGIQKQVLPADTQAIVVRGTVGSRDGHPLLRPDAYLAHPDVRHRVRG